MSYNTYTSTYTVVDIRKAFEGFVADLNMIARRTEKWTTDYVEKVSHDAIALAESKYLFRISISLQNVLGVPIRAAQYTVNLAGTALTGDRAGGNDWVNMPNTYLSVTLEYTSAWHNLSSEEKQKFQKENNFKIGWVASSLNTDFPNLTKLPAQIYGSNGYEVQKANFK